jgi:hypothetical protein
MSVRELATAGLRLMAIWFMCNAVFDTVSVVSLGTQFYVSPAGGLQGPFWLSLAFALAFVMVEVSLAVLLLFLAPRISRFVCREVDVDTTPIQMTSITSGDLYCIVSFLLGISVLLRAVKPAVTAAVQMMAQGQSTFVFHTHVAMIVEAVVYVFGGVALTVGARGVAQFLNSLGYASDSTPSQRFSLQLLLIVFVAVAVALGVMRVLLY